MDTENDILTQRKIYQIDGCPVRIKKYEDLTISEEEAINKILNFSSGSVMIDPLTIMPLILERTDQEINYKNASYKCIFEILTDFLAERTLFLTGMPSMMKNLLGMKIERMKSINESTEMHTPSDPD